MRKDNVGIVCVKKAGANEAKNVEHGIPVLLRRIAVEKISAPVPVKLQPSLASYVRMRGGSTFIRKILIEHLRAYMADEQIVAEEKLGQIFCNHDLEPDNDEHLFQAIMSLIAESKEVTKP